MKKTICSILLFILMITLFSCTNIEHTHTFSDTLSYDEAYHYYASTCGHDVVNGKEAHTMDSGKVVREATEESTGLKVYKCTVCDYELEEVLPKLEHTHTFSDVLSYDENYHYYASTCGHNVVNGKEAHTMDSGTVVRDATEENTGLKVYKCTVCDYELEEVLPKLEHKHTYSDVLSYDSNYHYYASTCGHNVVSGKEAHTMDSGTVVREATEESTGLKVYKCTVCDYELEEVLPKLEHTHTFSDVLSYDSNYHYYASTCGHDVVSGKEAHTMDSGTVVTEPTEENTGLKVYHCTVCDYELEEVLSKLQGGSLHINAYNTQSATDGFAQYEGLMLYRSGVALGSSLYWHKVAIIEDNNQYKVSEIATSGNSLTSSYDYLLLSYSGDTSGMYQKLVDYNFKVGDIIVFSVDLNTLSQGSVSLDVRKSSSLLDFVSDMVSSNTVDYLPSVYDGYTLEWSSSDNNLYTIENETGHTNRVYQTHQIQKVTVSVSATLNGVTKVESKEIEINPVLFDDMSHPKAVYFSVSSTSSYMKYNERYLAEGTLFSDKFKENMDMVYYAFAVPQEDGTLALNTTYINEVMKLKAYGIRVTLVIDGANAAPLKAMVKLCNDDLTRAKFVENIVKLVTTYNFDGVDVDWEFPGILSSQSGYSEYTTAVDRTNLNKLLRDLRAKFDTIQDPNGSNFILSVATPPTYWGTDRFDYDGRYSNGVGGINDYCDYVNMMSYDLNKDATTSHLSHVYTPSNSYSYKFCCEYGITYYTKLGLDKSKIILGAAAYGKAYKVTGTVNESSSLPALGVAGTKGQVSGYGLPGQSITWNSGTIYYTGIKILAASGNFKQYNEYNSSGKFVGSYLYSSTDKYFITYDSELAIQEKCKLAAANEGMGIMVWAYGEDATDTIVNTICDNLK